MADQPNPNQNQDDEEKELLEEAEIVVRNKDGSFSVVSGKSLLGEEEKKKEPLPKKPTAAKPRAPSPVPPKPVPPKPAPSSSARPKPIKRVPQPPPPPSSSARPKPKMPLPKQTTVSRSVPVFAPEKPLSQAGKASFVISAEDEKEIQQFKDGLGDQREIDINAVIDQIISQVNVKFADEMITRRFRSLLASRLKDVRTPVQFAEALRASTKIGGIELSEEDAKKVEQQVLEKSKKIQAGQIEPARKDDVQQVKEAEELAKKKAFRAIREEIAQRQEQAAKLSPKVAPPPVPKPPAAAQPESLQPRLKEKPKPTAIPKVKRQTTQEGKQRIADIKTPPKVIGPVEELRTITLQEFRQFSSDPGVCTQKIEEKIKLLEEDSLIKKAEGIKAWKQAEIYQLYLGIGNDSMAQGKSVKEIIQSRTMEGRPYLTEEEFNAVADLNRRLRF